MKSSQIALIGVASLAGVDSFTVAPTIKSSSALNLVPAQGKQLAAAWEAAATHLHDEPEIDKHKTPTDAARSFVARVFSLPSTLMHPKEEDEVLYYPIVGFQYVSGSCKALPPTAPSTAASCRIPSPKEEVYGWWSPACLLGHPDSSGYGENPMN